MPWDAWVAQSVECLILDFSSGNDLKAVGWSPHSAWSLLKILSLPLPLSPLALSLSVSPSVSLSNKIFTKHALGECNFIKL